MGTASATVRIRSMDQFRGYTVAGMFVVNFLGGMAVIPPILKHNNTFFSYADSIMPSFLFAAGFSYRLTVLRRLPQLGYLGTAWRVVTRSLALILLTLIFFGLGMALTSWEQVAAGGARELLARLFKANLWEVLAIIGVSQLFTLPVITLRPRIRVLTAVGFMAIHAVLSWSFNYEFVYGRPNWMDEYWGAAGTRAWDGGFFGVLMWSVPLLGGTLAYDWMDQAGQRLSPRLFLGGGALMILGYLLSCLSTLYDVPSSAPAGPATSAVWPPFDRQTLRPAPPPFVEPPPPEVRRSNYWMMDKRVVTITFILFSTGFAFALYGVFVLACDRGGLEWGLFRMLGQNPLAAYLLHIPVEKAVQSLVPKDSPLWWCLIGLAVSFSITVMLVRALDRRKLYLRL